MEHVLAQHFLLKHLSKEDLGRLTAIARKKDYSNSQLIFGRGDPATGMMAVISGQVRIGNYSADGKEIILRVVSPGEVFGEIALIDGGERTADARAIGDTSLLFLDRQDFLPFLEENPGLCIELMKVLCKRLRATSEQLEDFSFLELRVRLAKCLLHLAEQQDATSTSQNGIKLSLSQNALAAKVGTTREAVNKRLRDWEKKGILSLSRGMITILDIDSLGQNIE